MFRYLCTITYCCERDSGSAECQDSGNTKRRLVLVDIRDNDELSDIICDRS